MAAPTDEPYSIATQGTHADPVATRRNIDIHVDPDRAMEERALGYRGVLISFSIILCQFAQVRKDKQFESTLAF